MIHCHSEYSLKDSPIHIPNLCKRVKELGGKYISLTDHGNLAGVVEFIDACEQYDLKPIPGVEAYVESPHNPRAHLLLLAKNYKGYQEISRAVSLSYENSTIVAKQAVPIMTKDILEQCFKNGNVIATSACIGGVLGSILNANNMAKRLVRRIEKMQEACIEKGAISYAKEKEKMDALKKDIEILRLERQEVSALAKTTYLKKIRGIEKILANATSKEEIAQAQEALKIILKTKEDVEQAKKYLPTLTSKLSNMRAKLKNWKERMKKEESAYGRYQKLQEKIDAIPNYSLQGLYEEAQRELLWYKVLFGEGNFYIELQYHGIKDEEECMPLLLRLAKESNTPIVATNDVHLLSKEQAHIRRLQNCLRFEKWQEISPSEEELYLKSDEELCLALCHIIPEADAKVAIKNIQEICNQCSVIIPNTTHFPKYKNDDGSIPQNPNELLKQKAYEGVKRLFKKEEFTEVYIKRLNYELKVICSMGYADYFLIVADFIKEAKIIRKVQGYYAYDVGLGRGSAAGSLVAYVMGITNIDPIVYGLLFERFLNKDRVSMPDIDSDFANGIRDDVIQYVKDKYGADCVSGIRTLLVQKGRGAIRDGARLLKFEQLHEKGLKEDTAIERNSLRIAEKLAKVIPEKQAGAGVSDYLDKLRDAATTQEENKVIDNALAIEGLGTSFGFHAAGIIIGDEEPLHNLIPLIKGMDKKKGDRWGVQCDMVEAEKMGFLKMDFLGLVNLDIITQTLRFIYEGYGLVIDADQIPAEPEVFHEIYAKGNTSRVFQFESEGMKKTLREFQPSCMEDIILLNAAYRPGPMDFIPQIISNKKGISTPKYIVPSLQRILAPTYGCPIYQEQLMDIFHTCAGFTMGEADIIRRYMSKKKKDKFLAYKDKFVEGLMKEGATKKEADAFWESLVNFANYGFNKSHAAVYSILSYKTAWLKYHYPKEFLCATLNFAKDEDIPFIISECRHMNIKVLPPDINKSLADFSVRQEGILYGIGKIKGLKSEADIIVKDRNEVGKYRDVLEFIERSPVQNKTIELLIKSGAFDDYGNYSRYELLSSLSQILSNRNQLLIAKKNLEIAEEEYKNKTTFKVEENYKKSQMAYENQRKNFYIDLPVKTEDENDSYARFEKETLRVYVTHHPLDKYDDIYLRKHDGKTAVTPISEISNEYVSIIGIISSVKVLEDKDIAFFTIEDKSGAIRVSCFSHCFVKYRDLLQGENILKITGRVKASSGDFGDSIICESIEIATPYVPPVYISCPDYTYFMQYVFPELKKIKTKNGEQVLVHSQRSGELKMCNFTVTENVLQMKIDKVFVTRLQKSRAFCS